jgi:drug/metabolite transporter (DMT)-like permease
MRVRPSSTNTVVPDHWWASLFLALGGLLVVKWSPQYDVQSKSRPVLLQVIYVYAFVAALGFAWYNLATKTNLANACLACGVLAMPLILRTVGRSRADEPPHERVQGDADYPEHEPAN